jgi:glycosyltransferase involved in cell wall biosynthesis
MNWGEVLYVSACSPVPAKLGPARRNYHMLHQLTRFYDVSVLSVGTPEQALRFRGDMRDRTTAIEFVRPFWHPTLKYARKIWRTATGRCDFLPAVDPRLQRSFKRLTRARRYDAIFLSSVLLGRLPLPPGTPVVGDTHNVEFDVHRRIAASGDRWLRRQYARWQCHATQREERRWGRRVDLVLATSARDQSVFQREAMIGDVEVIPNGIDLAEFAPLREARDPRGEPVILFTGLMSYYPNQQAVRWFIDTILPRVRLEVPAARFIVAGAAPPAWLTASRDPHIQITGIVADMRRYLARATVVVAPLLVGGGTRVKILEACAVARPVVSTTLGAEGLSLRHGESILLADDSVGFASQIVRLLTTPSLRIALAESGRRHVCECFDWDRIGENLAAVLERRIGLSPRSKVGRPDSSEQR